MCYTHIFFKIISKFSSTHNILKVYNNTILFFESLNKKKNSILPRGGIAGILLVLLAISTLTVYVNSFLEAN